MGKDSEKVALEVLLARACLQEGGMGTERGSYCPDEGKGLQRDGREHDRQHGRQHTAARPTD